MKANNIIIELLDAFVTCNVLTGMNRPPLVLSMERNKKTATLKLRKIDIRVDEVASIRQAFDIGARRQKSAEPIAVEYGS